MEEPTPIKSLIYKKKVMKTRKIKLTLMGLIFLGFIASVSAQELKRNASLGIRTENLTDSIQELYNLKYGVRVIQIVEGSNAEKIGLQENDIILSMNNQRALDIGVIVSIAQQLRANDEISIEYFRRNKKHKIKTIAKGNAEETYFNADVFYESISYNCHQLRSILYLPKDKPTPPVVFFIQGYTCGTVEYPNFPNISVRRLINDWVDAGYAVFRVEKPGVGDSESCKSCMEMNVLEEIEAFKNAYSVLETDQRIDSRKIFLFGHSLGGVIAPYIASSYTPKGVITYGTVLKSWYEYMMELTRVQGEMFHTPYAEIEYSTRDQISFYYDMLVLKKSSAEMLENEKYRNNLESEGSLQQFEEGYFIGRSIEFWQSIQDLNLTEEWQKTNTHVLALYGDLDIQALNDDHAVGIANVVNEKNSGKGSYKIITGADHVFTKFASMEENIETNSNGSYFQHLLNSYHSDIAQESILWMEKLKK
jgi:esterase/lipase